MTIIMGANVNYIVAQSFQINTIDVIVWQERRYVTKVRVLKDLSHRPLRNVAVILEMRFWNLLYRTVACPLAAKLLPSARHRT